MFCFKFLTFVTSTKYALFDRKI